MNNFETAADGSSVRVMVMIGVVWYSMDGQGVVRLDLINQTVTFVQPDDTLSAREADFIHEVMDSLNFPVTVEIDQGAMVIWVNRHDRNERRLTDNTTLHFTDWSV